MAVVIRRLLIVVTALAIILAVMVIREFGGV